MIAKARTDKSRRAKPRSTKCHLLALPAELRNRIYEYTMFKDHYPDVVVSRKGIARFMRPGSLIFTCRQIMHEALVVYFQVNTFELRYGFIPYVETAEAEADIRLIHRWLEKYFSSVKTIRIHNEWYALRIDFMGSLEEYSLQIVEIDPWRTAYDAPTIDYVAINVQQALHCLAELALDEPDGGKEAVLSMDDLMVLVDELANAKSRMGMGLYFQAWLIPHAAFGA